jgi:hypothetical protein
MKIPRCYRWWAFSLAVSVASWCADGGMFWVFTAGVASGCILAAAASDIGERTGVRRARRERR